MCEATNMRLINEMATRCCAQLGAADAIMDTIEGALAASLAPSAKLAHWFLLDKLCKGSTVFVEALRPRLARFAERGAPSPSGAPEEFQLFRMVMESLAVFFGNPIISLILMRLAPQDQQLSTLDQGDVASTSMPQASSSTALVQHSKMLRTIGGFVTKQTNNQRSASEKGALQVRTIDSLMAMNVASAYAPARPVEIAVPIAQRDVDAPHGYMQPVPENHAADYRAGRSKRLREVMERHRKEEDQRARNPRALAAASTEASINVQGEDFSDVAMPHEFPRDEYQVQIGNFPLGVRFIRDAIRDCGGVLELAVIVQRISTLASKDDAAKFGNPRHFIELHKPTFVLEQEGNVWVVRLAKTAYPLGGEGAQANSRRPLLPFTADAKKPLEMTCPFCTQQEIKTRNFARHAHCRRCVKHELVLGLKDVPEIRGPVSELSYASKWMIDHMHTFDDDDLLWFSKCIANAAALPRYRLSSATKFAPMLKAIRCVRDRWMMSKGVNPAEPFSSVPIDAADVAVFSFFRVLGANLHRLPIRWIETGDIIDMCKRFSQSVLAPHHPPPRPADPRISLVNQYPGMLFCESEVDDEDDPSEIEEEYSDDEGESFQFAPPVTLVETLTAAGFERDTKRLNYKLRTAPPLALKKVLKGDGSQTLNQAYQAAQQVTSTLEQRIGIEQQAKHNDDGGFNWTELLPPSL